MVGAAQADGNSADFPIVGIGASAGGIQALQTLFKAMPDRPGLAFVVVQHLLPERPSQLATLIGAWTGLPILEARDGLKIECNCIYVAQSDQTLGLEAGVITTRPIDRAGGEPASIRWTASLKASPPMSAPERSRLCSRALARTGQREQFVSSKPAAWSWCRIRSPPCTMAC